MPTEKWLSRPLKEFVRSVAFAVAEGQEELDRRSIRVQRDIERQIERGELGYDLDASWLRFAEVEADLQMTLEIEGEAVTDDSGAVRAYRPVVTAMPVNPRTRTVTDVDAELSSEVRLRLTPVPPERRQS